MFGLYRFQSALDIIEQVSKPSFQIDGVWAVMVGEAPADDPVNPGGPQFNVYARRALSVRIAQLQGTVPSSVQTPHNLVNVVVIEDVLELARFTPIPRKLPRLLVATLAGPGRDDPIQPGSSIGGGTGTGTLGVSVAAPTGHFMTAGHVLEQAGSDVFQPGKDDNPNSDRVGTCTFNAFETGGLDSALVKVDPGINLSPVPKSSAQPSETTPAVGMYLGDLMKQPNILVWQEIVPSLAAVGATMPANTTAVLTSNFIGLRVFASGRTSGLVSSRISEIGKMATTARGVTVPVFFGQRLIGGQGGDSGAVGVVDLFGETLTIDDDGSVNFHDDDDPTEYLVNTFNELKPYVDPDPSPGTPQVQGLANTLKQKIEKFLRDLVDLPLDVNTTLQTVPCQPIRDDALPPFNAPDACIELIRRETGENPSSDADAFPEDTVFKGNEKCRTFGAKPVVRISGDVNTMNAKKKAVTLSAGSVSLRISLSVSQRVVGAKFFREGRCAKGVCEPELLRGDVEISRQIDLSLKVTAGKITLPGFGELSSGGAGFNDSKPVRLTKKIVINGG